MTEAMTRLVLQLALIITAARIGGYFFSRLRLPAVLGELIAGMIIGPYALGGLIPFHHEPLFALIQGGLPLSPELYGIATVASILLLFLSGLETDLAAFLRYSAVGSLVGLGGLIAAFSLGDLCAVWFGLADSFMDPSALFLGTISTATSVGITARILTEKRKMSSPEGVSILAGAVLDDVLGIVILAIVVGMTKVVGNAGQVNWEQIGWIATKAIGFWLVATALGLLLARRITAILKKFKSPDIITALCFGLALFLAGLSEMAGLAMIIGAYITGLALSRTDLAHELQERLHGVYTLLVPVFFCTMGMLVDFSAMRGMLVFGLVYSLIAVAAKVIGCGLPAYLSKFNLRGALRIGLGMLPRGEVALIVAGIGFTAGVITPQIFGVAIMMTLFTTLLAPPLLIQAFKGGTGLRRPAKEPGRETTSIEIELPSPDIAEFLRNRFIRALRSEEFYVNRLHHAALAYQVRKDDILFMLVQENSTLRITAAEKYQRVARLMLLEELLSLSDLLDATQKMKSLQSMGSDHVSDLF